MPHTIPSRKRQHTQSVIANSFASTKPTSLSLQPRPICITNWKSAQPIKVSAKSERKPRKWLIKLRQLQHRFNHHRYLQTVKKSLLTSFKLVLTPILLQRIFQSLASWLLPNHHRHGITLLLWMKRLGCQVIGVMSRTLFFLQGAKKRATMQGGRCLN